MFPVRKSLGIKVDPAMVAAPKAGDRVHARPLKRGGKLLGVERRADTLDLLVGVKVQMDLTKPKVHFAHIPSSKRSIDAPYQTVKRYLGQWIKAETHDWILNLTRGLMTPTVFFL
jgi:hypothetical protein